MSSLRKLRTSGWDGWGGQARTGVRRGGQGGYGNPYFKKGLEKLRYKGEGRETERILISLENEEKTF